MQELSISCSNDFYRLIDRLRSFSNNRLVVVDCSSKEHLEVLARAVRALRSEKRFLFRSAASLLNALADLAPQTINPSKMVSLRRKDSKGKQLGGLVIVGSHVPLADQQLERLLEEPGCIGIELPVQEIARVLDGVTPNVILHGLENIWRDALLGAMHRGLTPVLYTSRGELLFDNLKQGQRFSFQLANLMGRLAASVAPNLGYIISKGGITTQFLLAYGLELLAVQVEGQLLPGLSMVTPTESLKHVGLPILTFPGNQGDAETLQVAWHYMEAKG